MHIDASYDEIQVLAKWNAEQKHISDGKAKQHEARWAELQKMLVPRTVTSASLDGVPR